MKNVFVPTGHFFVPTKDAFVTTVTAFVPIVAVYVFVGTKFVLVITDLSIVVTGFVSAVTKSSIAGTKAYTVRTKASTAIDKISFPVEALSSESCFKSRVGKQIILALIYLTHRRAIRYRKAKNVSVAQAGRAGFSIIEKRLSSPDAKPALTLGLLTLTVVILKFSGESNILMPNFKFPFFLL
jgi:hypothetical protein